MRGMKQVKQVAEDFKSRGGGNGEWVRYFKLEDGETAEVLFLGTETTEPYISEEHGMRDKGRFTSVVCRGEKCVACHEAAGGDRRIGRVSPKASFTVYDLRWQKRTLNRKKTEEAGRDKYDYEHVDDSDVTEAGKAKGTFVRCGRLGWTLSQQWALALTGINEKASTRCKSCGKGRLTVAGYLDKDGKPANKRVAAMKASQLERALEDGTIRRKYTCSKCQEPVPVSIFNSVVLVTRTGENKSTTYQFNIQPLDEIPDDVTAAISDKDFPGVYDWEAVKKPLSARAMARELGVENPFGDDGEDDKRRGKEDDAEDGEEAEGSSDVVEWNDDEDSMAPGVRRGSGVGKKPSRNDVGVPGKGGVKKKTLLKLKKR